MIGDGERDRVLSADFAALKLRGGTWLQLRSLFDAAPNCEVEFVAALHAKSIFVTLPGWVAGEGGMQIGNRYLARGFNGTCEFAFTSQVLQVEDKPFFHAHLAYPDSVDMRVVRQVPRVKVSIPMLVLPEGVSEGILGTMKDLSVAGAMVESVTPLGEVGDKISLVFSTTFEARDVDLRIPAVIRHSQRQAEEGGFRSGLEFGNVSQSDKLALCYLLFTLTAGA